MGQGGAQALSAPWGGQATKAEGLESLSGPSKPGRELESSRNMGVGVAWARCSQVRVSCFRCSALKRPLWLWNLLGVDRSPRPPPRVPCRAPSPRPEGDEGTQGDPGAVNRKVPPRWPSLPQGGAVTLNQTTKEPSLWS